MTTLYLTIIFAVFLAAQASAQVASGGAFTLDQTVTAGGGSDATGGTFKLEGTLGQPAAGTRSSVAPFAMQNGFWTAPPFVPTAAERARYPPCPLAERRGDVPGPHAGSSKSVCMTATI